MNKVLLAAVAASTIFAGAAQAQGLIGGAQQGAAQGAADAGLLGGIVGGATGAATGTVGGVLGGDPIGFGGGGLGGTGLFGGGMMGGGMMGGQPSLGAYVMTVGIPSYSYPGRVRVGARLPRGVTYYVVPPMYGAVPYRYTIVNNAPVLVDPRTHRIVQILA